MEIRRRFTLQQKLDLFSTFFLFSSFSLLLYFYSNFRSPLIGFFFWLFVAHQRSSITSLRRFPPKSIIFHPLSYFLYFISDVFFANQIWSFYVFYVHRSCGEGIMPRKGSFNGAHSGAKQHPTYLKGNKLS